MSFFGPPFNPFELVDQAIRQTDARKKRTGEPLSPEPSLKKIMSPPLLSNRRERVNLLEVPVTQMEKQMIDNEWKSIQKGDTTSQFNYPVYTIDTREDNYLKKKLTHSINNVGPEQFIRFNPGTQESRRNERDASAHQISTWGIDALLSIINFNEINYCLCYEPKLMPSVLWLPMDMDKTRKLIHYFSNQQKVGVILNTEKPSAKQLNGSHWVVYVATYNHSAKRYSLEFLDSLGGEAARTFGEKTVFELFDSIFQTKYTFDGPVQVVGCPKQGNIIDCGILAVANAFYYTATEGRRVNYPPQPLWSEFRYAMARELMKSRTVRVE